MLNISWIVFYVRNIKWFIAVSIAHREKSPKALKIFSSANYLEEKTRVANKPTFCSQSTVSLWLLFCTSAPRLTYI